MERRTISIATLPSLPLTDRALLPECQCAYVVMEGKTVLYAGQTRNLRQRWGNHHLVKHLERHHNVSIAWVTFATRFECEFYERSAIELFRPRYNKTLVPREPTHKTISALVPMHIYRVLDSLASREGTTITAQMRKLMYGALEARGILIFPLD